VYIRDALYWLASVSVFIRNDRRLQPVPLLVAQHSGLARSALRHSDTNRREREWLIPVLYILEPRLPPPVAAKIAAVVVKCAVGVDIVVVVEVVAVAAVAPHFPTEVPAPGLCCVLAPSSAGNTMDHRRLWAANTRVKP
jgi:hypothetical protein